MAPTKRAIPDSKMSGNPTKNWKETPPGPEQKELQRLFDNHGLKIRTLQIKFVYEIRCFLLLVREFSLSTSGKPKPNVD